MPNCTQATFHFPSFDRRKIEANFEGGDVSSDGGVLLLREADRRLGLLKALDSVLPDPREPALITHRQIDLLRQRVYGLALGYEDLNDHDTLRHDLAWQTALNRHDALASSPTLCRLEQRANLCQRSGTPARRLPSPPSRSVSTARRIRLLSRGTGNAVGLFHPRAISAVFSASACDFVLGRVQSPSAILPVLHQDENRVEQGSPRHAAGPLGAAAARPRPEFRVGE